MSWDFKAKTKSHEAKWSRNITTRVSVVNNKKMSSLSNIYLNTLVHNSPHLPLTVTSGRMDYWKSAQLSTKQKLSGVGKSLDHRVKREKLQDKHIQYWSKLAIYAPMIYTVPCVRFLMRADTLRGQVGGVWPEVGINTNKSVECPTPI